MSAWSLIKPYWVSEERGIAWLLLIAIIAINMTVVYINVRLNTWSADFYNTLQTKRVAEFPHLLLIFAGLAFAYILLAVYGRYLRQMLGFRWRQWLTHRYLEQWLGDKAFYRIERDRLADNPDQRISDDLQSFATTTLSLSLDLLSTLVTLVTFITILWTLAGALTFSLFGTPITIPGYMVWAAALYAVLGSLLIQRFGHPLVSINYQAQKVEANFRFGLIRIRENAEQIAFYDGIETENTQRQGHLRNDPPELLADHEVHAADDLRAVLLRPDRDHFPDHGRGAPLLRRRLHVRRADADQFGVRHGQRLVFVVHQ